MNGRAYESVLLGEARPWRSPSEKGSDHPGSTSCWEPGPVRIFIPLAPRRLTRCRRCHLIDAPRRIAEKKTENQGKRASRTVRAHHHQLGSRGPIIGEHLMRSRKIWGRRRLRIPATFDGPPALGRLPGRSRPRRTRSSGRDGPWWRRRILGARRTTEGAGERGALQIAEWRCSGYIPTTRCV